MSWGSGYTPGCAGVRDEGWKKRGMGREAPTAYHGAVDDDGVGGRAVVREIDGVRCGELFGGERGGGKGGRACVRRGSQVPRM